MSINFPKELQTFIANSKDILTYGFSMESNDARLFAFSKKKKEKAWKDHNSIYRVPAILCPCSDPKAIYTTSMQHSY